MSSSLTPQFKKLDTCLIADRHRLRRKLKTLQRDNNQGTSKVKEKLDDISRAIDRSCEKAQARAALSPAISFPEELPVAQKIEEIAALVESHQVVIVAGETGSGKTTQLPKLCLQLNRGIYGRIGHTQPRRLAARSVAQRLREELQCEDNSLVGFQVRFTDTSNDATRIKLMTDGILLAEIQHDPWLNQYDTIIIDEAHERSLNIDFLLGYLKQLLPRRSDLKLIITSATIDVQKFSAHFSNAPVIEVSGRTYPVDLQYRPAEDSEAEDLPQQVLEVVHEIMRKQRSQPLQFRDILVFLTGEREIREVAEVLRKDKLRDTEILPLYARLSAREQDRIFKSHPGTRIVLATNVAETSLTVPGIGYVIDSGMARISRYSVRSKVQRLPVEAISQASAGQRAGRCGRLGPGVCYRLYSEPDLLSRPEFTDTEIMRTHLGSVILQMLSLRLGEIAEFPFLDRPEEKSINDGFRLLEELGAVDRARKLTTTGRTLARIPVDPRLARMVLEGSKRSCLNEILIITSAMSMQDPRERPLDKQQAADEKHRQWQHPESDFMSFVHLWQGFEEQRQQLGSSQLRKYCQSHFLSWMRMREWRELHRQLLLVCRDLGFRLNSEEAAYETVHQSLLTGLLNQIACKQDDGTYLAARNRRFHIFPGSILRKKKVRWILSGEMVETSQFYARTNARIEPEWAEALAGDLLKREYLKPHWSRRQGRVMAWEKVSLYGLVLTEKRRTAYSGIDPVVSRELFIREGLVAGHLNTRAAFYHHNQKLVKATEALEEKTRRRDILVDESELERFYEQQLPEWVNDVQSLETWLSRTRRKNPGSLFFEPDMLKKETAQAPEQAHFPDTFQTRGLSLGLDYTFNPGSKDDGVSVNVPVSLLGQVKQSELDWLVPGMLKEKCIALVKTLPKPLRKHFVPVPDTVEKVLPLLETGEEALTVQLARQLQRYAAIDVSPADFGSEIDSHLQMNIQVSDAQGKVLGNNRSLEKLQRQFASESKKAVRALDDGGFRQAGLKTWSFGDLPESLQLEHDGQMIETWPALVDDIDSVSLDLVDNRIKACNLSRAGIRRLFMLKAIQPIRYLNKEMFRDSKQRLQLATLGRFEFLLEQTVMLAVDLCFHCNDLPTTKQAFEQRYEENRSELINTAMNLEKVMVVTAEKLGMVRKALSKLNSLVHLPLQKGVQQHLDSLFIEDFPRGIPVKWLAEYPRYLEAVSYRLERFKADPEKDAAHERELQRWWSRYCERRDSLQGKLANLDALEEFRWLLEEYRVSLFAQQLGTRLPVSAKRLQKYWDKL